MKYIKLIYISWIHIKKLVPVLYNKQHSIPAIYIPLHLYNQFLLICS